MCISLIIAESSQGPDKPPKLRICSNVSKGGFDLDGIWMDSVNSFVEKEKFPTSFDLATMIAEWVSFLLLTSIPLYSNYARTILSQMGMILYHTFGDPA